MSAFQSSQPLPGVDVHVLDGLAPLDAGELLSNDETLRASRLRDAGQAQAYVCAHAALRRLIAARTQREPRELRFSMGPHGKPAVENAPDLHFSISYRKGCAAVAIAQRPVGIDVESLCAGVDTKGIAQRFFTPDEQAWIAQAENQQAFYRLWTRKEALVKAAGVGVDAMGRAGARGDTARLDDEQGRIRQYRILQLDAPSGFALALAVEEPEKESQ
ncbi:MAG TPA: 4'-phosphopantetheinyl transferase superfamily protein [Ramlibacter sp.]|nr:4'-phosphopantetheinyl transferase superfamily protein [Ramlibacter sp.]